MKRFLPLLILMGAAALFAAEPAQELVQLAKKSPQSAAFREKLMAQTKAEDRTAGRAWAGYLGDFVFAVDTKATPGFYFDEAPGGKPVRLKGSDTWIVTASGATGRSHNYYWQVDGKPLLAEPLRLPNDVPAFGPLSYEKPGVPQGKVTGKMTQTSTIYPGMKSDFWVYVPAQYDAAKPAALMVWQDGEGYTQRPGRSRLLNVIDNLTHEKKIPVAIQVFINPGMTGDRRMRSVEYDSVDDTYAKYLRDEILKEVEGKYNIRKDGYSRFIAGESSGAICAFNVAWWHNDHFTRVLSRIGSYTSIQWKPWEKEGGNIFPFLIRKSDRKNIRVWASDGHNDLENTHGSWPLQNIAFANSLKMKEYDHHFVFGNAQHNTQHGNAELPEALTWLWRGYDSGKTSETFVMDPEEKTKPYWRVRTLNRE
ncbi:MAG TPA: alpha/beta hydrolase-fold protein [Bryobacteraceae bacterium]|nr:alpha/beta hydrolase-fold protein [Bryobacteraceae bacterium]